MRPFCFISFSLLPLWPGPWSYLGSVWLSPSLKNKQTNKQRTSSKEVAIFFFFNQWSFPKYFAISLLWFLGNRRVKKRANDKWHDGLNCQLKGPRSFFPLLFHISIVKIITGPYLLTLSATQEMCPYGTSLGNLDNFLSIFWNLVQEIFAEQLYEAKHGDRQVNKHVLCSQRTHTTMEKSTILSLGCSSGELETCSTETTSKVSD